MDDVIVKLWDSDGVAVAEEEDDKDGDCEVLRVAVNVSVAD